MSKKGENIFKRKDGRWEARYVKGYTISGKIIYGFCYGRTYKEAKTKVFEKRMELYAQGDHLSGGDRPFFAFFGAEWLKYQREKVRDSTYIKYENILNKQILPFFGEKALPEICTPMVDEFRMELLDGRGLAPKTVKDILAEFNMILKFAAKRRPGDVRDIEINYPKMPRSEIRVLNLEEQRRLIDYLKRDMDACKFGTLLALLTGMRIGELCALRWSNISLADRTIRVDATMQRLRNLDATSDRKTLVAIGSPKSDTSARLIPMSDSAFELCAAYPLRRASGFVLTGTERYMEPRALQRHMERYARDCDLAGVHFHTLRHTFATRCVEAGFELKSLSEVLGHANTTITLERYVHSSLELKRRNMNKLSKVGL